MEMAITSEHSKVGMAVLSIGYVSQHTLSRFTIL